MWKFGTVAKQFLFWEYLFRIFSTVSFQCTLLYSLPPSVFPALTCIQKLQPLPNQLLLPGSYVEPREYWMVYWRPLTKLSCVRMIRLLALPLPPSFPSATCFSFSVFLCVAGRAYWRERRREGVGVDLEPKHTTARKPGPLYSIQHFLGEPVFQALCFMLHCFMSFCRH